MMLEPAPRVLMVMDSHLVIAGDGFHAHEVKKSARLAEKTVKRRFIHFVGEREDMLAVYSMSDYVIGTGRVALEAMACKRPVLAVGSQGYFGLVKLRLLNREKCMARRGDPMSRGTSISTVWHVKFSESIASRYNKMRMHRWINL